MKAVSCILWTAIWIMLLALISLLAEVAGTITAAISVVTVVGLTGSLSILFREEDGTPHASYEQPVERASAEVVSSPSLGVQPSRLALPAPKNDRTLTRLNR